MSELDFDELDKAVNNLMSGVPKVEPPKNDDIKTLDIDAKLPESSRPPLDELNDALKAVNGPAKTENSPVATNSSAAPATGSLATRRAGRFMDVVHPSSDMKNTPKPAASRQGVTIEPAARPLERPTMPTEKGPIADDEPAPVTEPSTSAPEQPSEAHSEWPDPLSMSGYEAEEDTKPVAEDHAAPVADDTANAPVDTAEAADTNEDQDDDSIFSLDDIEDTTPEPLTSPFISDAKVEKRPLGGPATETPVAEPAVTTAAAEEDQVVPGDDPDDQLPATAADVAPILPPELQKDLMAIETDGDTSAPAAEAAAETPAEPTKEEAKAEASVAEKAEPVAETPVPAGPASIPQQYKEEPSTGDQTNGGIYDTNNYHQPLAHPVKKKSGWLWIVWILLLLIIGGGGAAVLYLFNII
jgi:hypothetical protein